MQADLSKALEAIKRDCYDPNENVLPLFFMLLGEATNSSDAVDMFDLDSNNPESVKAWQTLLAEQEQHIQQLIEYIQQHGNAIITNLGKIKNALL